jgi:hypothetical protein
MMTVQANKSVTAAVNLDAPVFDPQAFRLNDEQAGIIATARELGQTVFAARAAGSAPTTRPTPLPPPKSAAIAAPPR